MTKLEQKIMALPVGQAYNSYTKVPSSWICVNYSDGWRGFIPLPQQASELDSKVLEMLEGLADRVAALENLNRVKEQGDKSNSESVGTEWALECGRLVAYGPDLRKFSIVGEGPYSYHTPISEGHVETLPRAFAIVESDWKEYYHHRGVEKLDDEPTPEPAGPVWRVDEKWMVADGPDGKQFGFAPIGESWVSMTPIKRSYLGSREEARAKAESDWKAWYIWNNNSPGKLDETTIKDKPEGRTDTAQALNRSQEDLESLEQDIKLQLDKNLEEDAKTMGLNPSAADLATATGSEYKPESNVQFSNTDLTTTKLAGPEWKLDHDGLVAYGPDLRKFSIVGGDTKPTDQFFIHAACHDHYTYHTPISNGNVKKFSRAIALAEADWKEYYDKIRR